MAALVYIKSLLWLVGLGGLGFGLLKLTSPSSEKIAEIKSKNSAYLTEDEKRKLLFIQRLKQSTTETPIYSQKTKDSK